MEIKSVKFDPLAEIMRCTEWIRGWFRENGDGANAVIGLSGGKDSTIVAALLVKALGENRVVGILMPDGKQADIDDARHAAEVLKIRAIEVNIGEASISLRSAIEGAMGKDLSEDSVINLPPRVRMTTLYAITQSLENGGRVVNTCNRSEDYIGYSTKFGDAAGDVAPCANYTVGQMLMIGDALGLPSELVHKAPSDGLSGMTDEEKIGFSYDVLDEYILTGKCDDRDIKDKIDRMHRANLHKLNPIPAYAPAIM